VDGRIILKYVLKKVKGCGFYSSVSECELVTVCWENGDEAAGSIKGVVNFCSSELSTQTNV